MDGELRTKTLGLTQDVYDRIKKNKKGYGEQCKKKYFNNIYWITLCIVYDLLQNVMNNIQGKYASRKTPSTTTGKRHRLVDDSGNLLDLLDP